MKSENLDLPLCLSNPVFLTCKGSYNVLFGKQLTETRQKKVKECKATQRKDGLKLEDWNNHYHRKICYADFTSSDKIAIYLEKGKGETKCP